MRADVLRIFFVKNILFGNTKAGGRPHIGNVDVLLPVVVEIEPTRAHPGAYVFDAGLRGNGGELPASIVAIEIASSESRWRRISRPRRSEL